jgi:8-oxo-dGTP pyrophosphatase MutT (NUDIX family)
VNDGNRLTLLGHSWRDLKAGEIFAQATIRELLEETGLEVEDADHPIWFRRKLVQDVEAFHFLVRVETWDVIGVNSDELEQHNERGQ